MMVFKTIWVYDVEHIIELCFDGILFHLLWTPPQQYVNKYEFGFYTQQKIGDNSSWTDWMQQNCIPYNNYNYQTAEESCH